METTLCQSKCYTAAAPRGAARGHGGRRRGQDRGSSLWQHRGDAMGQLLVSGDGPMHRFSTCSSQGLLLVTVADPS